MNRYVCIATNLSLKGNVQMRVTSNKSPNSSEFVLLKTSALMAMTGNRVDDLQFFNDAKAELPEGMTAEAWATKVGAHLIIEDENLVLVDRTRRVRDAEGNLVLDDNGDVILEPDFLEAPDENGVLVKTDKVWKTFAFNDEI
jgi:hypothetical protein